MHASDRKAYHRQLEKHAVGLRPYPGISTLVQRLQEHYYPIAVFSGASRQACDLLLRAADLARFFQVIVGGDEVERSKPSADGLLLACARLGVHPSAYVGDSNLDVQTAKAAGCLAYAAGWGHLFVASSASPDRELRLPNDLLPSL